MTAYWCAAIPLPIGIADPSFRPPELVAGVACKRCCVVPLVFVLQWQPWSIAELWWIRTLDSCMGGRTAKGKEERALRLLHNSARSVHSPQNRKQFYFSTHVLHCLHTVDSKQEPGQHSHQEQTESYGLQRRWLLCGWDLNVSLHSPTLLLSYSSLLHREPCVGCSSEQLCFLNARI